MPSRIVSMAGVLDVMVCTPGLRVRLSVLDLDMAAVMFHPVVRVKVVGLILKSSSLLSFLSSFSSQQMDMSVFRFWRWVLFCSNLFCTRQASDMNCQRAPT